MKPIKQTNLVQVTGGRGFAQQLHDNVCAFQDQGYEVEVNGFSTCDTKMGIVYSALIILR